MMQGIPDGYELVRIGTPEKGELFLEINGNVDLNDINGREYRNYVIVRKLEPETTTPAPDVEPGYPERQAEWVKANDLKVGDRVKILRMFSEDEQGFLPVANPAMLSWVGSVATVDSLERDFAIRCKLGDRKFGWPYFVLEKVPALKIEAGKYYRRSDGEVFKLRQYAVGLFPDMWTDGVYIYRSDGSPGSSNSISAMKIVEEVKTKTRPMTRDEFVEAWKKRGYCPLVSTNGSIHLPMLVIKPHVSWVMRDKSLMQVAFKQLQDYKFHSDGEPCSITEPAV